MHSTVKLIADYIELGANGITLVLGVVALYGLITQGKNISLIFRLYLNNHFNQRAKKISDNVSRLHELNYDDKADKAEIIRLLHALRGQIRPWLTQRAALSDVYHRLDAIVEKKTRLTQGVKSEIAHEIDEVIGAMFLNDLSDLKNK